MQSHRPTTKPTSDAPRAARGLVSSKLVAFSNRRLPSAAITQPSFAKQLPFGVQLEVGYVPGMTVVLPTTWDADFQLPPLVSFCGSLVRQALEMVVLVLPSELQPSDDEATSYWDLYAVIVAPASPGAPVDRAREILQEHLEHSRRSVQIDAPKWMTLEHPASRLAAG